MLHTNLTVTLDVLVQGLVILGGISYGAYQLASNAGSVDAFIQWVIDYGDYYRDYANSLNQYDVNSDEFIN